MRRVRRQGALNVDFHPLEVEGFQLLHPSRTIHLFKSVSEQQQQRIREAFDLLEMTDFEQHFAGME